MNIRCPIIAFTIIITVLINVVYVNAWDIPTTFDTTDLDGPEKESMWLYSNLTCDNNKFSGVGIDGFAVNTNGHIAIAFSGAELKNISVYDGSGKFIRNYSFHSAGSYGVGWNNENLCIYLVRASILMEVDSHGNLVDMKSIINNSTNNSYWNNVVRVHTRIVNDEYYELSNNMGGILNNLATSYSILSKTDRNKNIITIYDSSKLQYLKTLMLLIIISVFILIVIIKIIRLFKTTNK